jgi:hypothetical protein
MKQYNVLNKETGYNEYFYSLSAAKTAMRENNAKGFITKIYANGDWVSCGEITLKGSNKTFIANSQQRVAGY